MYDEYDFGYYEPSSFGEVNYMEWNKVKDGNPNFFGKYLVVCKGIYIPQIRLYEGTWDSIAEVTHWMELPKMPKDD